MKILKNESVNTKSLQKKTGFWKTLHDSFCSSDMCMVVGIVIMMIMAVVTVAFLPFIVGDIYYKLGFQFWSILRKNMLLDESKWFQGFLLIAAFVALTFIMQLLITIIRFLSAVHRYTYLPLTEEEIEGNGLDTSAEKFIKTILKLSSFKRLNGEYYFVNSKDLNTSNTIARIFGKYFLKHNKLVENADMRGFTSVIEDIGVKYCICEDIVRTIFLDTNICFHQSVDHTINTIVLKQNTNIGEYEYYICFFDITQKRWFSSCPEWYIKTKSKTEAMRIMDKWQKLEDVGSDRTIAFNFHTNALNDRITSIKSKNSEYAYLNYTKKDKKDEKDNN